MTQPIILHIRGDQIGTYSGHIFTGNGPAAVLTLTGVEALGTRNDWFTVEVRQTNGAQEFQNGQFVTIKDAQGNVWFENANPQHDEFQGRAASTEHQIFSGKKLLIDLNGVGRGLEVYSFLNDNGGKLPFKCLPHPPQPCFLAGTMILMADGKLKPVELIEVGDRVWTHEGDLEVLWTGSGFSSDLWTNGKLCVTGQHRILTRNGLMAAKHCPDFDMAQSGGAMQIHHFLLERHGIVVAEETHCESMWPGSECMKMLGGVLDGVIDVEEYQKRPAAPFLNKHGEVKK